MEALLDDAVMAAIMATGITFFFAPVYFILWLLNGREEVFGTTTVYDGPMCRIHGQEDDFMSATSNTFYYNPSEGHFGPNHSAGSFPITTSRH